MIHPTEDDFEYKRQNREDKGLAHLGERREPPIGDPCERCDGEGKVVCCWGTTATECPRCQGTGVW